MKQLFQITQLVIKSWGLGLHQSANFIKAEAESLLYIVLLE